MKFRTQLTLTLFSAIIMPLCFPPIGWWPLTILVFPPLLLATNNTTSRRAFYFGLLHGTVGYGITLRWLYLIFGTGAVPLFMILGLFHGIFCLLFNTLSKQNRLVWQKMLLPATLWTAIEFYRAELFFLRFPWITAGSAVGPTILSPVIGVYGISFLVMTASAGLIYRKTVPIGILISVIFLCLGLFRPGPIEIPQEENITVTIVQNEDCLFETYASLTRQARDKSPDLVIWPEYSLPYDARINRDNFNSLLELASEMNAIFVIGTQTVIGPEERDWHNTALVFDQDGVIGEYYKVQPVHFFRDGIPGKNFAPFKTRLGMFSTPICFDCDYSEVARKMVLLGAEFFAVPSFDAETWSADQHFQHSLLFRLRAAENARWLACAASSGVSQVVDPHGNTRASILPMEPGVITCEIGRNTERTFFNRVGWTFPWFALFCTAGILAHEAAKHLARRLKNWKRFNSLHL